MEHSIFKFAIVIVTFLINLINIVISRGILSSGGTIHDYVQCSKIWNVFGSQIHVGQNEGHADLAIYNFVPDAIQVKKHCVLTMEDDTGFISNIESTILSGQQCWLRPITFACCECYGCMGALTPEDPNACAVLYEDPYCSACIGVRYEVYDRDRVPLINPALYDRISSIIVKPGCQLTVYKNANFSGDGAIVTGIVDVLQPEWNDVISSYQCICEETGPPDEGMVSSTVRIPSSSMSTHSTSVTSTVPPSTEETSLSTSVPTTEITTTTTISTTTEPETTTTEPTTVSTSTQLSTSTSTEYPIY